MNNQDRLRAMYVGGRGNATARRFARLWIALILLGLPPRRWVVLEVPGRRSGRLTQFPLGMVDMGTSWYVVSMLGEGSNWVRNVRAADGLATVRRRRKAPCHLAEVPVPQRAAIIKRFVEIAPGGRPHIPVDRSQPTSAFEQIADRYPAFRLDPKSPAGHLAGPLRRPS